MIILENRNELLDYLPKQKKICEIGVFKGDFSKILFQKLNPEELHLIDIFEGRMCSGDENGNNIIWVNLDEWYENIKLFFEKDKNVFLHKGKSVNVLNKFEDEYFDMIYIDGDHSYNGVKSDLDLSFKKVKSGGVICGHDYTKHMFEGVVKAVDEFCEEKKLSINYLTKDGCPTFCIKKTTN